MGLFLHLSNEGMVFAFAHLHFQLGCTDTVRQTTENLFNPLFIGSQYLQQPCGRINPAIKPVPALFEEEVATHFTRKRCVELSHLVLDQRVAGFVHHRITTGIFNHML